MTKRYALRDDQWEQIKDLLPGRTSTVGVTAKDNRLFVEAVLYRYRSGIPWRDLPERFGDFRVVHTRFSRWAKAGVWQKFLKCYHMKVIMNMPCWIQPLCALINTVPEKKEQAIRRSKGGLSTQIHAHTEGGLIGFNIFSFQLLDV